MEHLQLGLDSHPMLGRDFALFLHCDRCESGSTLHRISDNNHKPGSHQYCQAKWNIRDLDLDKLPDSVEAVGCALQ